ncbi:cytochrome c, class I [Legionella qingyii]|uniref:Cytochrome c n=1 Tax=Legionella qingyii TaxID=2184757 RepID=A0A317U8Z3_9GAMM|nr:c-type cytochrome [Legionella qingyii]PWY56476.1 cytochrome c, class I [Legionella qingyii]PWY57167.1 cytochrome c, class I [Legionella qingyii]RUR24993.1 cytochrome c [Legionella qingyii]RUR28735.1 cytochrome c [Legionella qingyii]
MKGLKYSFLLIGLWLIWKTAYTSSESSYSALQIASPNKSFTLTKSELLTHPDLTQVTINNDRAYPNRVMHHKAIPLCKLLAPFHIGQQDIIEFIAKDNFHVYVPSHKIMDCSKNSSIAMLAIEPISKWPIIDNHTGLTAGPYEIIWLYPERSYISNEYWAWSVITIKISRELNYQHVLAPPKTTNASIANGYKIYISHCEGCHMINHVGKSDIGPDLNCPKNPLNYYPNITQLKKFIRDPESVRILPQGRMSGSDKQFLSDNDLDDLIKFFAYMNTKKQC